MIRHTRSESIGVKTGWIPCHLVNKAVSVGLIIFNLLIVLSAAPAVAADIDLGGESKLTIHGFLSQAYANSTGGIYLGIPQDGTTDYRNTALQFRYEYSSKDAFVIQFSEQRLGESPVQAQGFLGDVQLNWVFYERRLFDNTTIKVGKFPIPLGIYNEVLHVGTVLPFFRPPFGFYGDGSYTSETINGVGLYQALQMGESWGLEADLYAGGFTFIQLGLDQNFQLAAFPTEANDVLGGALWLYTPIEGLRIGAGGYRSTDQNEPFPFPPDHKITHTDWWASLDARLDRFLLQAEYRWEREGNFWTYKDYYILGGVKLTKELAVHAAAEFADMEYPGFASNIKATKDYTLGARYAFRPNLIAKGEYHLQKGYMQDDPIPDYLADPVKVNYYIVSLAVSF